jgi:hypothetical protein
MVEEHQQTNEEIIYDLLMEFKDHRNAVMSMVSDIEKLKEKIDRIIPEKLDARYVRFFEEKVKTATEFFKTLLEMRKEIQKSLKDEIEIRRKINVQEGEMGVEDIINIRDLVDKVEGFKRDKDKIREKTVKIAQDATDKIGEEVQKMNAM